MMALFRDRLKARGARGLIGLQRMFNMMDDDGSRSLSLYEFTKACRDYRIGISDEYLPTVFNAFDINADGTLSVDEFLTAVRGPMSQARQTIIEQAYQSMGGAVNFITIREAYKADRHPDVLSGKKTVDQALVEFLETFETHLNTMKGSEERDSPISLQEFLEYYRCVSSSIDDDS